MTYFSREDSTARTRSKGYRELISKVQSIVSDATPFEIGVGSDHIERLREALSASLLTEALRNETLRDDLLAYEREE